MILVEMECVAYDGTRVINRFRKEFHNLLEVSHYIQVKEKNQDYYFIRYKIISRNK